MQGGLGPLLRHVLHLHASIAAPQTVPSWARARVACHTAADGEAWAGAVQRYNSGTGTNQYMVGACAGGP